MVANLRLRHQVVKAIRCASVHVLPMQRVWRRSS